MGRRHFRFPTRTRERIAQDVDEELAFHLEMRARELEDAGLDPASARAAAQREFGDLEGTRRALRTGDTRAERGRRLARWIAEAHQDARLALRQLVRTPVATALALTTLAVGIGAPTAMYSVVRGVLVRPLPYPDADRLVVLEQYDRSVGAAVPLAPQNFADWQERSRAFVSSAVAEPYSLTLTGEGEPVRLSAWRVTPGFFETFGAPLWLGRGPLPTEYAPGSHHVVVLSRRVWQSQFSSDPAIVGRRILLDDEPHTVIGVVARDPEYPTPRAVIVPRALDNLRGGRLASYVRGIGRLAPGVTPAQAQQEADVLAAELADAWPSTNRQMGLVVTPLQDYLTHGVRHALLVLLGAALLVMLIGCANVGHLLLARGLTRRRELAVRRALGAGRARLARQLLTEGAVLTGVALGAGVGLAVAALGVIRRFPPADLPRLADIRLDGSVLAFALGIGCCCALLAGLAPAIQQSRAEQGEALRETALTRGRRGTLRALVTVEVMLAFLLTAGSGLLLRSYAHLVRQELGFRPKGALAVTIHVWDRFPDPPLMAGFFRDLLDRLAALPGVRAVAAANSIPFSIQGSEMDLPFVVAGRPEPPVGEAPTAILSIVTPGYFQSLAIPVRRGRVFTARDDAAHPPVTVVGEALVRRRFADRDPLGEHLRVTWRGEPRTLEIVGVVADVRHERPDEVPRPEIYVPLTQQPFGSMTVLIAASGEASDRLVPVVRRTIWSAAPGLTFDNAELLDRRLADVLAPRRVSLVLAAGFAGIAVLLALGGVYGALAFSVSQRVPEIGVRLALGATRERVVRMVVTEGVVLAVTGTVAGLVAAVALLRVIGGLLYGISPTDPVTLGLLFVALPAAAALAAWLPARRAAGIDPVRAIRVG